MEITRSLKEDISKIQDELITAIQNHQVLVWRQQVSPNDNIRTQIEEVQRHIICLGESQKLLVSRLQNELKSLSLTVNNNKHQNNSHQRPKHKSGVGGDVVRNNNKLKKEDITRSVLGKKADNKERSLLKNSNLSDGENISERKAQLPKDRQPSIDSSSEENRTPCESPDNVNSENEQRGKKRTISESHCQPQPNKRPKSTLQATPRPSSPVPARSPALDALTSSSEESMDSLLSQQPESENKAEFALALGLITKEVYNKVIKKTCERRRRKVASHHPLYSDLWDLTVIQKRTRSKYLDDADDASRDCGTPQSTDSDSLCFICRKPGELRECRVCQTGCHGPCVTGDICPACTHRLSPLPSNPLVEEKKKELDLLRLSNKELHKSVSKLRERAKVLSASLVVQTATVNQLAAKEDKIHESIKKIKVFITSIQSSPSPAS